MRRLRTPAERIYRALLVVFPRDIRRDAGPDMARQFADRLGVTRGRRARAALWVLAVADLVRHGLGARLDRRRQRRALARRGGEQRRRGMAKLAMDLRYGVRAYLKTPGSTLVAVAAIALGIGANAALFSYADALFLRPLPVIEPGRLVSLFHVAETSGSYSSFSLPDFTELRDQATTLSGVAAWSNIELDLGDRSTTRVAAQIVSGNYFDVLRVSAAVGRVFHASEDQTPDAHPVVVISQTLWRRHFGADPAIVGRAVPLNGRAFTVLGVAPDAFAGLELASDPQAWVPLMMHRAAMPSFRAFGTELFGNRGTHWLELTARLAPGVPLDRAAAELRAVAGRQALANPETNKDWTIAAIPAQDGRLGPPGSHGVVRLTLLLLVVVGLVLAIVCANVANLLLARAAGRQREVAVRLAIGASRSQVIRQMLTESLLLSGAGGLVGVFLAMLASALLPSIDVTGSLPGLNPRIDGRVLLIAVGLIVLTGVASGLAPALRAAATSPVEMLKSGSKVARGSRRWSLRQSLVALQVGVTMVLMTGAALTLRTIQNLYALPLGFDPSAVWIAPVDLTQHIDVPERGRAVQRDLLDRVRSMPGVTDAAFGFMLPFRGSRMANDFFWVPPDSAPEQRRTNLDMNVVGPDYFRVMGIPVIRGRAFDATDRDGMPDAAVVNRAVADRLWPNVDPVGRTLWSWNPRGAHRELRVVGVVENGRYYRSWRTEARPFVFVPAEQWYQGDMSLHARGGSVTAGALRRAIEAAVPGLPTVVPIRLADAMSSSMAMEQTAARVLGAFGVLALAIAAIGIYSVVTFTVGRQTREIGIRMALGAGRHTVMTGVIAGALKPIVAGLVAGWLAAVALTQFITSLLFGVRPGDPVTYAVVALALAATGAAASFVPARRATRADPLQALRTM
jgi:predicted permease